MAEIKVPKPPKKAFNPDRPASALLRYQVEHLEWAVRHAGERRGRSFRPKGGLTESDVAARIAALIPRLESAARLPPPAEVAAKVAPRKPRRAKKRTTTRSKKRGKPSAKAKARR